MPADHKLHILLVEDDPIHARIMSRVLCSSGINAALTHLNDGESAVRYITEPKARSDADGRHGALPDLLLLDLQLPRIDGFDVLHAIRSDERTRHLPVVVISTSDRQEDVMRSYGLGANAYLCKSPDFDVFADRLSTMCRFWGLAELPTCIS